MDIAHAAHSARARARGSDGFTLIEMLVVVLIIGVLAAIALPSFLGQREKGQDACAKALTKSMQTAMMTFQTENGSFLNASPASLTAIEATIADGACGNGTTATVGQSTSSSGVCNAAAPTRTQYCVSFSSQSTNRYAMTEVPGTGVIRSCQIAGRGSCSAASSW